MTSRAKPCTKCPQTAPQTAFSMKAEQRNRGKVEVKVPCQQARDMQKKEAPTVLGKYLPEGSEP